MSADDRFWAATERAEEDFTGRVDVAEFRRRMRKLGHEDSVIRERVEAIHPDLLGDFDRLLMKSRRLTGGLSWKKDRTGAITCWFFGGGQMPPALRPALMAVIGATSGSKIDLNTVELAGVRAKEDLLELGLAYQAGKKGQIYLSVEGGRIRRCFRQLCRDRVVVGAFRAAGEGHGSRT